jgi:hypothetical protein
MVIILHSLSEEPLTRCERGYWFHDSHRAPIPQSTIQTKR